MLVELDEEHTKCGICIAKFSSDRDNKDPEIRKHLPVLSSSQRCDHWFCHGCILREQLRVAEENNGRIPKWIRCMHCREKTSFNPAEPKFHRLLIDLLARAQKYAAAQVKAEQTEVEENETTDVISVKEEQNDAFEEGHAASEGKVDGEGDDAGDDGARSVKRETDINDLGEQEVKRMKLIAPSPPLVRVKEEPIHEMSSLERRAPINGINTSITTNANYITAAPKVVDEDHHKCSVCKVAKSLDCFSISQRKKGENAKCKDCIRKAAKDAKEKRRLLEKKREAEKKIAAKNKAMEDLEERICVNCNIVKKKQNFGIKERKKGEASVCMSCKKDAKVKIREQQRMKRGKAIKFAVEENAEKEARTLQMAKGAYEHYVTRLNASGSIIEKEMTKQSDQRTLEIRKRKREAQEQEKLAAKNKTMEDLEGRTCLQCKIVKKKEGFDINERKNGGAPKVVDKDQLMCSVCNVAKSLDCFSKKQTKKGQQCKDCIGSRLLELDRKRKRDAQEQEKLASRAAKHKAMEDLEKRKCCKCKIVKKKEGFDIYERKNGGASVCLRCRKKDQARVRRIQLCEYVRMKNGTTEKWNMEPLRNTT